MEFSRSCTTDSLETTETFLDGGSNGQKKKLETF